MRPKPQDHAKGNLEYLGTIRGTGGSLDTLVAWFERSKLSPDSDDNRLLRFHFTRAYWSVNDETDDGSHVEFDIYNSARHHRFNKVIPHRTDTACHRQKIGEFLYLLAMSGYQIDLYRRDDLKEVEFTRQLDWEI